MSRALDADTASSIQDQKTDVQSIYNDISSALTVPSSGHLEIELLGRSHHVPADRNVLIDGIAIAVPKTKLVQAFVYARAVFLSLVRSCPRSRQSELMDASSVILLMDPEHLTAANARKRMIQNHEGSEELTALLEKELRWVDGYLTSRMHRHTKSPTLWGHRRWLLALCKGKGMGRDLIGDLENVVMVAAERHPKNYYAWGHMRWLVHQAGFVESAEENNHKWKQMVERVRDWCLKHPGDISGWSYLSFLLERSRNLEMGSAVLREVLRLTVVFKWTHEAVWVFLRTLAASRDIGATEKIQFFQGLDTVFAARPEAEKTLVGARSWCMKHDLSCRT